VINPARQGSKRSSELEERDVKVRKCSATGGALIDFEIPDFTKAREVRKWCAGKNNEK